MKAKLERMQNVTIWSLEDGVAEALGSEKADPVAIRWNVLKAPAA